MSCIISQSSCTLISKATPHLFVQLLHRRLSLSVRLARSHVRDQATLVQQIVALGKSTCWEQFPCGINGQRCYRIDNVNRLRKVKKRNRIIEQLTSVHCLTTTHPVQFPYKYERCRWKSSQEVTRRDTRRISYKPSRS